MCSKQVFNKTISRPYAGDILSEHWPLIVMLIFWVPLTVGYQCTITFRDCRFCKGWKPSEMESKTSNAWLCSSWSFYTILDLNCIQAGLTSSSFNVVWLLGWVRLIAASTVTIMFERLMGNVEINQLTRNYQPGERARGGQDGREEATRVSEGVEQSFWGGRVATCN